MLFQIKLLNREHDHFQDHKNYVEKVFKHKVDTTSSAIRELLCRHFKELRVKILTNFHDVLLRNCHQLRDSQWYFRAGTVHDPCHDKLCIYPPTARDGINLPVYSLISRDENSRYTSIKE